MAFFNSCLAKLSKIDMNGNIRKKRRKKVSHSLFFLPCIFALSALPVLYLSTLLKFATYCFLWWLHFLNLQTYPPWFGRHTLLFLSLLIINGLNSLQYLTGSVKESANTENSPGFANGSLDQLLKYEPRENQQLCSNKHWQKRNYFWCTKKLTTKSFQEYWKLKLFIRNFLKNKHKSVLP